MKEKDKVPFLDAPVSSNSLFGPAVEGFAEHFTEAQKSSQAMNFYAMHGCSTLPSATDRNPHPQLPRRLAHSGPVRGSFNIAQDPAPPPGAQGQLFQEHTVTQPMNIIPGDSYRLSADDNNCLSGDFFLCLLSRKRPPAQGFPENAGPLPSHWFDFIALHEPIDVHFLCVIQKASVEEEKKMFYPYSISDAVLVPISQGTEVTFIVTKYV